MADEKKPEAKPAAPTSDPFVEIVSLIFGLLLVVYLVNGAILTVKNSKIFSGGWKGLTAQGILERNTRPISSLFNAIGANVVSIHDTKVYDSPDGDVIGEQKVFAKGKILQGPVLINGGTYWYVDYEEGEDGWVREENIGYMEKELGITDRIAIAILRGIWYIKVISVIFSIIGIYFTVLLFKKINSLSENERKLLYPENPSLQTKVNHKWERVLNCAESLNENDWRLAILEADIMLDDLLDKLGLPGETMGDKLKAVEPSDFETLDNAWEAHKIRNQIAHEGAAFQLNQHEVRRVIALYQNIFEEFQVI